MKTHLAVLAAVCLVGCGEPSAPKDSAATSSMASVPLPEPAKTPDNPGQFTVDGFKIKKGQFGVRTVTGIITNNTHREYRYAQVEINLYDKEGNLVGSTLANVNNFSPEAKWKFVAPILQPDAVRAEIKDVRGM